MVVSGNHVIPFQVFDVLDAQDFKKVLAEKNKVLKSNESPTIHRTYSRTYTDEGLGVFSKLRNKLSAILTNTGFIDPTMILIESLDHDGRTMMHFHKHRFHANIDPYEVYDPKLDPSDMYAVPFEYFWVAIYYPHNIHGLEYHGQVTVRLDVDAPGYTFDAVPNSVVFHNALYGHEVRRDNSHPKLKRDSCYSHWVCKMPN